MAEAGSTCFRLVSSALPEFAEPSSRVRQSPADRPTVAVWLGIETANEAYVLPASGPQGYGQRAVLVETSERRGVPIILPDGSGPAAAVSFDVLAKGDVKALKAASRGAEALLLGMLSLGEGGFWNMDWHFEWRQRRWAWAMRGVSFDTALKEGVHNAALMLSGQARSPSRGAPAAAGTAGN